MISFSKYILCFNLFPQLDCNLLWVIVQNNVKILAVIRIIANIYLPLLCVRMVRTILHIISHLIPTTYFSKKYSDELYFNIISFICNLKTLIREGNHILQQATQQV